MRVNKKTLLLEDLTWEEVEAIRPVIEAIVMDGVIPNPSPQWLELWYTECGFKEQNRLLVLSTVMPQRILLSLLRAMDSFSP